MFWDSSQLEATILNVRSRNLFARFDAQKDEEMWMVVGEELWMKSCGWLWVEVVVVVVFW